MSSNKLIAPLLAIAVALCLSAPASATVSTFIGTNQQTTGTSLSMTTTGDVPAGGLLVVTAYTTGAPTTPTVSGCTFTQGMGISTGSPNVNIFYCTPASLLAMGATITITYGTSGQGVIGALMLPATVTTIDLNSLNSNNGTGSNPNIPTGAIPSFASSVVIEADAIPFAPTYTPDANFTLLADIGTANQDIFISERVLSSAAAFSYSAMLGGTRNWVIGYNSWKYSPGGGTICANTVALLGAGLC